LAGLACLVVVGLPRLDRVPSVALLAPAVGLALLPAGLPAAASGGLIVLAGVRYRRRQRVAAAAAAERASAVEAVSVLASELRAGRSPGDGLAAAARVATGGVGGALAAAGRAVHAGADPVPVLRAAPSAAGEAMTSLAACLQVCAGAGGSLAAAVETVADALRSDEEQRLAVAAELAGPRATAVLLAGLPLAGVALAAGIGARPLHVLLQTAVGGCCLVAGVLLDLAGLWWTDWLVTKAVS
jgi:tight adherence protein B